MRHQSLCKWTYIRHLKQCFFSDAKWERWQSWTSKTKKTKPKTQDTKKPCYQPTITKKIPSHTCCALIEASCGLHERSSLCLCLPCSRKMAVLWRTVKFYKVKGLRLCFPRNFVCEGGWGGWVCSFCYEKHFTEGITFLCVVDLFWSEA